MNALEARISILTKSLVKVDINQSVCPFCGSKQDQPEGEVFVRHNIYDYCLCDGMQEHRQKLKEIARLENQYKDISETFELRREKAKAQLMRSGIGKRFLETTFSSFGKDGDMHAYQIAYDYACRFDENDGENIIFLGDVGTGKTHLAAAIANYLVEEFACSVEFYNFSEALSEIRAAFSDDDNNQNLERKMCEADMLIIDDLGKEKATVFSNEVLYRVINYRYKEKLPIVVTANTDLASLYERLDEAVFSRLVSICKAVQMQGIDYRMKKFIS